MPYPFHHLHQHTSFSETFYYFASGIGLLLAGSAGLKYIWDIVEKWKTQRKIQKNISKYKNLYQISDNPISDIKKEKYNLIRSNLTEPKIFLHSHLDDKKHWIQNSQTYADLGFYFGLEKIIPDTEMSNIQEGEGIITQGKPWT